ncbi:uncharacterized protein JCM15063_003381 [Sporobolomyces koalae]|uniref:uncharacterized protein n=1 Tax=Sporobolomyces koalae TaxID=500713 RepID=UPI00317C6C58
MYKSTLPKLTHVLELCLYTRSLPRSIEFYSKTLQLGTPSFASDRLAVFPLASTTLILFQQGLTHEPTSLGTRGTIPGHGLAPSDVDTRQVKLASHFALAVSERNHVEQWEQELRNQGVEVTGTVDWPAGGKSVYFKDLDGHVGEIASRGIWPHY